MLVLEDLPAATRIALVAKLSDTLAQFVVARNWLSTDRAERNRQRSTGSLDGKHRSTFRAATTCAGWCGIFAPPASSPRG